MGRLGYRCIDIDFHFSEYARDLLTKVDPQSYARMVSEVGADSVMVYAKDHWGNVYHDTKVSHKHAAVKGDLLRDVLDSMHGQNLAAIVFFSVCWDEYAARHNPDWVALDAEGKPKRWYGSWTFMCINSPYRDYVFKHLEEVVSNYDFEAIFIDPFNYRLGVNAPCYCPYCRKLWRAEFGEELPARLTGEKKAQYMDWRDRYFGAFLAELRKIVKAPGKDIQMTHIFGTVMDHDDWLNVEGDPFGQDYYTNSIKTKIYRAYAAGRPLMVLTERFSRYWDFTMKSPAQLEWELATIFAHNAAFMLVDHADIRGELHPEAYEVFGKVIAAITPMTELVRDAHPYADIALLYSERDEELVQEPRGDTPTSEKYLATIYRGHLPDFVGAFKMLTESHLPFDVLVATQLTAEKLAPFKVLVVPSTLHIDPHKVAVIQAYVKNGGNLIFTHRGPERDERTRPLPADLRGFGLVNAALDSPYTVNFVRPTQGLHELRYIRVNSGAAYVSAAGAEEVLGHLVHPALERTDTKWVTHNEIPGEETVHPAVVVGRSGSGGYGYFAFGLFREYLQQDLRGYRELFLRVLNRHYSPEIVVEAPRSVEANYLVEGGVLHVVLTNCTIGRLAGRYDTLTAGPEPLSYPSNIDEVVPVAGIRIRTQRSVKSASDMRGHSLNVITASGQSSIELPQLGVADVVTLR